MNFQKLLLIVAICVMGISAYISINVWQQGYHYHTPSKNVKLDNITTPQDADISPCGLVGSKNCMVGPFKAYWDEALTMELRYD